MAAQQLKDENIFQVAFLQIAEATEAAANAAQAAVTSAMPSAGIGTSSNVASAQGFSWLV